MLKVSEPFICRILSDDHLESFYEGNGRWTQERDRAKVFAAMSEVAEELPFLERDSCTVLELSPRPQRISLTSFSRRQEDGQTPQRFG